MKLCLHAYRGRDLLGFWLRALLCIIACLAHGGFAAAQTGPAIQVEGNQRIDADTIRSYVHGRHGQTLDAADLDDALKALYATRLFEDVRIRRSGEGVIVTVTENRLLKRVAFEGNGKIKDDQLKKEVQSTAGGTLWRPMVQQDVEHIVEAYHRSGYFDASVEPKMIDGKDRQAELVFEIKEGKKVGVGRIVFTGNKAYGAERLKSEIKTGTTNILSFLLNNDLYDPDRIATDQSALRDFYLKHGYADVRVAAATEFDPAQKAFTVTFKVDEGSLYRYGTVDIRTDIPGLDATGLRSKLRTDAGSVFNAEAVQKTVEQLAVEAAREGHPFAAVHPADERDRSRLLINLTYAVEQGPRNYVERINIRGNSKTRDDVIRRELDIAEGDAYNRALVERAERRLKALGYFKTVKISSAWA